MIIQSGINEDYFAIKSGQYYLTNNDAYKTEFIYIHRIISDKFIEILSIVALKSHYKLGSFRKVSTKTFRSNYENKYIISPNVYFMNLENIKILLRLKSKDGNAEEISAWRNRIAQIPNPYYTRGNYESTR